MVLNPYEQFYAHTVIHKLILIGLVSISLRIQEANHPFFYGRYLSPHCFV